MKAYRFTTNVWDSGAIQLPLSLDLDLFNQGVEVIILLKPEGERKKIKAMEFVEKRAGFLSDRYVDEIKFDYLSDIIFLEVICNLSLE